MPAAVIVHLIVNSLDYRAITDWFTPDERTDRRTVSVHSPGWVEASRLFFRE